MLRVLPTLFCLFAATAGTADETAPVTRSGPAPRTGPSFSLTLRGQYLPTADFRDEGDLRVYRAGYTAALSLAPPGPMVTTISLTHEISEYDFDEHAPDTLQHVGRLRVRRAGLMHRRPINERWSMMAMGDITSAGEAGASFSDTLTYGALVSFRYQWRDNVAPSIGLLAHTRPGRDVWVIPVPGLDWTITDRLSLRTANGATLAYRMGERKQWEAELAGEYFVRRYRLDKNGEASRGALHDRMWPVTAGLAYAPNPGMRIQARAGYILGREILVYDRDDHRLSKDRIEPDWIGAVEWMMRF